MTAIWSLLGLLVILGVLVWGVKQLTPDPIDARFAALFTKVLYIVAVLAVVAWVLSLFGVLPPWPAPHFR